MRLGPVLVPCGEKVVVLLTCREERTPQRPAPFILGRVTVPWGFPWALCGSGLLHPLFGLPLTARPLASQRLYVFLCMVRPLPQK